MVAVAKRFFLPHSVTAALPQRNRMALAGFMDELMRSSQRQGSRLFVDTSQRELAEACYVSVSTVRRWERRLVEVGLLRVARMGAPARLLEILDPSANRAVDNSVENGDGRETHYVTSDVIIQSPVTQSDGLVLMSGREGERSRLGRPEPERPRELSDAQTADARQVARGIVHSIAQRLGDACTDQRDARPWRLGRKQTSEVEDRIAQRLEAINRGTVSDLAIAMTRKDVDRVVAYSLKATKPAAHLYRAITSGDWRSDPAPGSEAAKVAKAGKRAEMPVQDLKSREGPPKLAEPPATVAERKALEGILEATRAPKSVRATAARMTSSRSVRDLTARLTDAWMRTMAKREGLA
jgi:hypothetical protein